MIESFYRTYTDTTFFFFFARISKSEEFTKLGTKCPRQYYLITTAKSCYIKQVQSIMVNLICTKFLHIFPLASKKGPFGNNTPKILKFKKKKKKKKKLWSSFDY